ncbi:MAG: hypothetical protein H6643_07235 [Caldilineaceae bacterium]|nr:hypothetical protein [Caldilineaceae bacterium]
MILGVVALLAEFASRSLTAIFANLGVSIPSLCWACYQLSLCRYLKTAFPLPPSADLPPACVQPMTVAWGMEDLSGLPRGLLDFFSQMYVINGAVTLNWKLFSDASRHLILPVIILSTIPMSVIARQPTPKPARSHESRLHAHGAPRPLKRTAVFAIQCATPCRSSPWSGYHWAVS